jgi:vacuolar-type H+-ATPase subunit H
MVKEIVDRIRDAEIRAEKLVADANADSRAWMVDFARKRQGRLDLLSRENEALRKEMLSEAEKRAGAEESEILARSQEEINRLRAGAEKKKEEAIAAILRRILET